MVLEFRKRIISSCFVLLIGASSSFGQTSQTTSWYNKLLNVKNRLTTFASDTIKPQELWKKSSEKIRQFKLPESLSESIKKFRKLLDEQNNSHNKHDKKKNKEGLRQFIEFMGDLRIASGSSTLNEFIQQVIDKHCPNLRQTDYFNDPVKAISYYLVLDGKGFIENVKLIQGPLGVPMTLREAYEYYTRTDPEKAEKMLVMLEKFQNLTEMDIEKGEKLKHMLDALKTNLELLKLSNKKKK